MMRLINIAAMGLVVSAGVGLYQLKYNTERVQDDVSRLKREIVADEAAIKVLRAEWTYLARPERLETLGNRYLALRPTDASQIIASIDAVPLRADPSAVVAQGDDFRAVKPTLANGPMIRPKPPAPVKAEPEERFIEVRRDPQPQNHDLLTRINMALAERQHD